ncbi:MAG: hypothetical protein IJ764_07140 [Bacteroidales bacterium]|nr:hypothetical protein [Bacteroidales bacterium]
MKKTFLIPALTVALLMAGCSKDDDNNTQKEDNNSSTTAAHAYLINQGNWGGNNAELSYFDPATGNMTNNYFASQNNRKLGDLAQDILQYGSQLFVTVSGSGTIEIIDPMSGKCKKTIEMGTRYPRSMAAANGKIYVSCYYPQPSVIRIDTATYEIEATCTLGEVNPEGLCIAGDNIYVCNSYAMTADGGYIYDSTLSVVNLSTFTETGKIVVGVNPNFVKVLSNGKLAVGYYGDYYLAPAGVAVVTLADNSVNQTEVSVADMDVYGGNIYVLGLVYAADYSSSHAEAYKIDGTTMEKTAILTSSLSDMTTPNAITINATNGDIYISDAQNYSANGDLYGFRQDGSLRWKAETTMLPTHICFIK